MLTEDFDPLKGEMLKIMDEEGNVDRSLLPRMSKDLLLKAYRTMLLTRLADDKAVKLQRQGRLGAYPPSKGQEASQLGPAMALKDQDWLVWAFREMGALLWKGVPLSTMYLYWMGNEMGNVYPEGVKATPSVVPVGSQIPHAVGIAYAARLRKEKSVALAYFGDGATSEGDFHEAMNFAAVFQAPVIFLCQNNQWAISVPYERQTAAATVAQKAVAYGMPGIQVDGNDIFAVYRVTKEAVERARNGEGPTLIEAHTYRMSDHTTSDDARRYRTAEELAFWQERDPLERLARYMRAAGMLDETAEAAVAAEAEAKVAGWVEAFEAKPPSEPEEIFRHVFAEPTPALVAQQEELLSSLNAADEGR